ncbi:ankyrin repeat-containing protein [Anaeramoeba ignava]|uniref:Ankyrin repeat-containing protein n=1 Tax=Anaeramoeba ignava TaxID=1746090 RepID=A0A9Q0R704_ANAIG|nr:ankyrin repeat-containing protein [Anaeramoeba ignava]
MSDKEKDNLETNQITNNTKNYLQKLRNLIEEKDKGKINEPIQIDIPMILEFMKSFPTDEFIQENSCFALRKFSETKKIENTLDLITSNAIELLLKAMNNFPRKYPLQYQSFLTIINIGNENEIKKQIEQNFGSDSIISTMILFQQEKQLYSKGIEALEVLGLNQKEIETKIKAKKKNLKKKRKERMSKLKEEYQKSKTSKKDTLLHFFSKQEPIDFQLFHIFLKKKNQWNKQDCSPVHYLCRNKSIRFEMIKLLIEIGANFKLSGYTPIHDLCENESITKEMIQILLDNGADFHIQKYSPLHCLCKNKSITADMIRILVNKGVNFNLQKWSPLHLLCKNPSITEEMINILKGTFADFNLKIDYESFLGGQKCPQGTTPKDLLEDSLKKLF